MARQLKARAPDSGVITRPKVLIFGPPGAGKTWVSLDFPKVYYIDTEGGASLPQYQAKLKAADGAYLGKEQGSQDFGTIIGEIEGLATLKHDYLTLVIDSFSKLYNLAAAVAEERVGSDFGRDKKEAQRPTKQLMLWLERLDMNVILICHSKEKWGRQGKELVSLGQTFDGWEKMEYDLHLCLSVGKDRRATVVKSRLEGFPVDTKFAWSFEEFEKRAGHDIMLRPAAPMVLASEPQIAEIHRLLGIVKMPEDWEEKIWTKAGVTGWSEMEGTKIQQCITLLQSRINPQANVAE